MNKTINNSKNILSSQLSRRSVIIAGLAGIALATTGLSENVSRVAATQIAQPPAGKTLLVRSDIHPSVPVTWLSNGHQIASGGKTSSIDIWDATTGARSSSINYSSINNSPFAVSPDGKHLVTANNSTASGTTPPPIATVWNTATGQRVLNFKNPPVVNPLAAALDIAWSPDGKYVAAVYLNVVYVWEASTGKILHTLNPNGNISRVAWSHTSRYIVAGHDALGSGIINPQIYTWNSDTGALLYKKNGWATAISISPDDHFFAHADNNTVKIRSLQSGAIHTTLPAVVNNQVVAVGWSPDGTRLAYSGGSTQSVMFDGYVNVSVLATGKTLHYTGQKMAVMHLSWSPDSTRIASVSLDQVVNVWQAR
ncbi:WD40 repeat domain-containing protein [Dictyobacter arantiisoli]|uniref:Uncharacterized protein n=1 Tax=Dictyobacter arantiisoli TaxID=2014874 RepID=A0A5A5T752_9CHLR|nr:PD40 domain-containing protein [Dictyobacter arantiisoli]GCF07208.1 hypothetical protein KDI_07720 [Dictyobacter arantiisoli]